MCGAHPVVNLHEHWWWWWWFSFSPGPNMRKLAAGDTYQGEKLQGELTGFDKQKQEVLMSLRQCLEKRFADVDAGVLRGTKMADLQSWPANLEEATRQHL